MNIQTPPKPEEIQAMLGLDAKGRARRWSRRLLWFLAVAGVLAGGVWWYVQRQAANSVIQYETTEAALRDLVITVTATGNVKPTTQVDISSEMSGVIRTVNVDNNSEVRKDDILAELDTASLTAQRDKSKATLASVEAQITSAKATVTETNLALQRADTLHQKGLSAAQDLDQARAAHDRAEAALLAAEAEALVARADLEIRETDLVKTRILSPINGIVLSRKAEPGQTVASSLSAPVLFTLAEDLAHMQLEANVDEADIGQVKENQNATFTVEAYPDRVFPATIETVEFSPTTTDNVVTYTAILRVDNQDLALRPGMTATAQIVVRDIPQALTIPNSALRYAPPKTDDTSSGFSLTSIFMPRMPRFEKSTANIATNGERTIWILEGQTPREITIKTGASDGQSTEVLAGDLVAGAKVIIGAKQGGS